jgi:hypothetical protein
MAPAFLLPAAEIDKKQHAAITYCRFCKLKFTKNIYKPWVSLKLTGSFWGAIWFLTNGKKRFTTCAAYSL